MNDMVNQFSAAVVGDGVAGQSELTGQFSQQDMGTHPQRQQHQQQQARPNAAIVAQQARLQRG